MNAPAAPDDDTDRYCPGPLVWFDLDDDPDHPAAVLECSHCEYVIVTGTFHDAAHSGTPMLRGA